MEEFGDGRIKHLEFIQAAISRLANTSSIIKGWTLTVVTAIFAAAAARTSWQIALVAMLPVVVFWLLDAFFLQNERAYRELYEAARTTGVEMFSMDAGEYRSGIKLIDNVRSPTLVLMYGGLIVLCAALCVAIGVGG